MTKGRLAAACMSSTRSTPHACAEWRVVGVAEVAVVVVVVVMMVNDDQKDIEVVVAIAEVVIVISIHSTNKHLNSILNIQSARSM